MVCGEVELRQDGERGGRHGEREREGIFNPLRHRPFAGLAPSAFTTQT